MNIKYVTVGKQDQLPVLEGVNVSLQITDGNIEAVVISQGDKSIRVVKNGTYNDYLKILTNSPEQYTTKYKASFTSDDGEYRSKVFDSEEKCVKWFEDNWVLPDDGVIEEIKELVKDSW